MNTLQSVQFEILTSIVLLRFRPTVRVARGLNINKLTGFSK